VDFTCTCPLWVTAGSGCVYACRCRFVRCSTMHRSTSLGQGNGLRFLRVNSTQGELREEFYDVAGDEQTMEEKKRRGIGFSIKSSLGLDITISRGSYTTGDSYVIGR
jgi:hypothetical protein